MTQKFKAEKSIVYLRFNWISTSQKLRCVATNLAERCRSSRGSKRQVLKDFAPAFNVVLTSLEVSRAYLQGQWVRIVTDPDIYGGKAQRSPAHNRNVVTALKWLIASGYLTKVDGKRVIKVAGSAKVIDLPYAYVITDKWRSEIADQPISYSHEIVRNPLASYVQLRKKIKTSRKAKERSVALQITPDDRLRHHDLINDSEELLEVADSVWRRVKVCLGDEILPAMQTTMTRIFNNGSFNEGGRFYCQLQNLPKDQRTHLRFDDEPTLEIDFSGMHPHLLYHLQGDDFSDDPYDVEGFDRDVAKVAFNTLINRDSNKHKGSAARSLAKNLHITHSEAVRLENAIYKMHFQIAGHFNSGYGLKLQKLDSQIAFDVMAYFFKQLNRPILMIHDSAIVAVSDVAALKLCMVDAYRSEVSKALQMNTSSDDFMPIPKGLKVSSVDFNETLTNAICRALDGIDVHTDEWKQAIKAS